MRHVHAAVFGGGAHLRAHVLLVQMQRVRAEGLRHGQALGHAVDREHVRGADRARGLNGAQPDRAETQHRGDVAGAQAALHDRVEAGSHHVAGEQRDVVAHALGDAPQHEVGVRHERLVGLRPLERAEGGAVAEGTRLHAAVVVAAPAEEAHAACALKAAEHAVADRHARDRVADGEHRADVLVADREARFDLHAPVEDVQVRAAYARGLDAHDRVFGVDQLGLRALLDAHHAGRLEGHSSH